MSLATGGLSTGSAGRGMPGRTDGGDQFRRLGVDHPRVRGSIRVDCGKVGETAIRVAEQGCPPPPSCRSVRAGTDTLRRMNSRAVSRSRLAIRCRMNGTYGIHRSLRSESSTLSARRGGRRPPLRRIPRNRGRTSIRCSGLRHSVRPRPRDPVPDRGSAGRTPGPLRSSGRALRARRPSSHTGLRWRSPAAATRHPESRRGRPRGSRGMTMSAASVPRELP